MGKALCALAILASLSASSCVGPNNAYNGIAAWNSRVTDSKWGNELIYIGLWVIPVYEVTFALDQLLFNSLEFWGGDNMIGPPAKFDSQKKK